MPLHLSDKTAILEGVVTVEEAEPLTQFLRDTPGAQVDLGSCTDLHTAALQSLIAARVKVAVPATDEFLRQFVVPVLERAALLGSAPKQRTPRRKRT